MTVRRKRRNFLVPAIEFVSLSRGETTQFLTKAIVGYWIDKRFSNHIEFGLNKRGNLRADVWSLNTKCNVVISEVKSSWADFSSDKKWHKYFEFCNKFYFVISERLFETHGEKILARIAGSGAGLICVSPMGKAKVKNNATLHQASNKVLSRLLIHAAWRGGTFR